MIKVLRQIYKIVFFNKYYVNIKMHLEFYIKLCYIILNIWFYGFLYSLISEVFPRTNSLAYNIKIIKSLRRYDYGQKN